MSNKKPFNFKYNFHILIEPEQFEYNQLWDQKDEYAIKMGYKSAADAISSSTFPTPYAFNKGFQEYVEMIKYQFGENIIDPMKKIRRYRENQKIKQNE